MSFQFKHKQTVPLRSLGNQSTLLMLGLGWTGKKKTGIINRLRGLRHHCDLDLSCVLYDNTDEKLDTIWYAQLQSKCGGIRHKGDQTVGEDNIDNETVMFDLNQIDKTTKSIFFVVSAFRGGQFNHIENCYWRLYDPAAQKEIARFAFNGHGKATTKIILRMQKSTNEDGFTVWNVTALDELATGKNIQEVLPEIRDLLDAEAAA